MARTVAFGSFEWDREKAWRNLAKHKVSFEEAATVFSDQFFFAFEDLKHSLDEDCYVIIGTSEPNRLNSCLAERKRTRIISARKSNYYEARLYQEESGQAL